MDRSSDSRSLAVWMNGERVGLWSAGPRSRHEFRYDASWAESPGARPISLSLPLAPAEYAYTGETVEAFFDNLLPDSADIRRRVRQRYGAATASPFDLLSEIGRDCVGAVQLLPPTGHGFCACPRRTYARLWVSRPDGNTNPREVPA